MNSNKVNMLALAVIVVAFGIYIYINRNSAFNPAVATTGFVSKIKPIAYDYNSQAGFYSGGSGYFYFYTKDGVSYRSAAGDIIWNDPYDISHPTASGAGNFLALAELRGQNLRVYGPQGLVYSELFEMPILNFSVNELGYSCVKLQNGDVYQTNVYTDTGELQLSSKHNTANMFPITAALSPDGKQMALSLLDTDGVDMQAHVLFYHVFSAVGSETWGGYKKADRIVASLKFADKANLLAASDSEITHYSLSSNATSAEGATVAFEGVVRGLAYMDDAGVAIAQSDTSGDALRFYNSELSLIGEFSVPSPVTYLHANRYGVIAGAGHTYYGFNTKGLKLWQYTSAKDLKQMIFLGSTDTLLEVGYTETRVLKREKIYEPVEGMDES